MAYPCPPWRALYLPAPSAYSWGPGLPEVMSAACRISQKLHLPSLALGAGRLLPFAGL